MKVTLEDHQAQITIIVTCFVARKFALYKLHRIEIEDDGWSTKYLVGVTIYDPTLEGDPELYNFERLHFTVWPESDRIQIYGETKVYRVSISDINFVEVSEPAPAG